jgi:histidine decarboxylase
MTSGFDPHRGFAPRTMAEIDATLARSRSRIEAARADHMGYPYNLSFSVDALRPFDGFLVNNLGDPYIGSHYASEVCELEREVVGWFERLWDCEGDEFWGSVGTSGTEGNLWAIYLGRESLPAPVLLHSDEAHYSIPKAGRILGIDTIW